MLKSIDFRRYKPVAIFLVIQGITSSLKSVKNHPTEAEDVLHVRMERIKLFIVVSISIYVRGVLKQSRKSAPIFLYFEASP